MSFGPHYNRYKALAVYSKGNWAIAAMIVGTGGHILSQLTIPWAIGRIIDGAIAHLSAVTLLERSLLLGLSALGAILFQALSELASVRWATRSSAGLQADLFAHLFRVPVATLSEQHTSHLHLLFTTDIRRVAALYNPVSREVLYGVVQLLMVMLIIGRTYPAFILLALIAGPCYAVVPLLLSKRLTRVARAVHKTDSAASEVLQESLAGMQEIRAYRREQWSFARYENALLDTCHTTYSAAVIQRLFSINYLVYMCVCCGVYWYGGTQVAADRLTVGGLITLVSYLGYLDAPISRLIAAYAKAKEGLVSLSSVLTMLQRPVEAQVGSQCVRSVFAARLDIQGVTFAYPNSARAALRDLTLHVEEGQRVAVIGPSGSGKSTLAKLVTMFCEPQLGEIRLSGVDLRALGRDYVRSKVSLLSQEPFLFSSTVRDNIRFGNPQCSQQDIEDAAKQAGAHDFIINLLSDGYDSPVGERGCYLSVGQRQRLSLARAFLAEPSVLICDEATSALDSSAAARINEAIDAFMRGRTCITITHNLESIADYDVIVVLSDGFLVATGTHTSLLAHCGVYQSLCVGYSDADSALRRVR